jgi:multisubunit Na+/H+ antiporter MnhE subunit
MVMIILLITHITIALSSLLSTSVSAFWPSKTKLNVSYGLITSTLVSGTALVILSHHSILGSCEAGLIYLCVAMSGVIVANRRLASQTIKSK